FDELERLADPRSDVESIWSSLIDAFVAGIRALPGGTAIRRAVHAIPELRELDQRDNAELAARVAAVFRPRRPARAADEANAVARTLLESAAAVIDLALLESPARSRRLLVQLKRMHSAYLAQVL